MTYDLWRGQDLVNPCTHADIIVLSNEETVAPYPYWYACVIGIFHVFMQYTSPETQDAIVPQHFDLLWVQWFARNQNVKFGWEVQHLPLMGFYPGDEEDVFGFINPDNVIQGVHLMPAFCYGCTSALLQRSIVWQVSKNNEDWDWYFVNLYILLSF